MTTISWVTTYTAAARQLFSIVAAFALLSPWTASAAEPDWQFVTTSDDRIVYVDMASIRVGATHLTASVLYRFEAEQTPLPGKTFRSSMYLVNFECDSQLSGFVSVANYAGPAGDGAVIDLFERSSDSVQMKYARPRTLGHTTLQFVCSRANAAGLRSTANLQSRAALP